MVLLKRQDYALNGYQFPTVPRGSRSARGKHSARRKAKETQMCAFELLATVAGKLLLEKKDSSTPTNVIIADSNATFAKYNVNVEQHDELEPFEAGPSNHARSDEFAQASDIGFQRRAEMITLKDATCRADLKFDPSENVASHKEPVFNRNADDFANVLSPALGKLSFEGHFPAGSFPCKVEDGIPTPKSGMHVNADDTNCLEEPMKVDTKPPALVISDTSFEAPLHGDQDPCSSSFSNGHCDIEVAVDIDDDENSSGCTHPCSMTRKLLRPKRIGRDWRIRKLLASNFCKVGPMLRNDVGLSDTSDNVKADLRSSKSCYTRPRTRRCSFKRKRMFDCGPVSISSMASNNEGISSSPEMVIKGAASCSVASDHEGQKASTDYHVKLSIKSLKIPELFVEIPEGTTIGSLKRMVMEAVTGILGGGLQVGVLLQEKEIQDDNKTLIQAGISHTVKLDSLGFILEHNPSQAPQHLTINRKDTQFPPVREAPEPPKMFPTVPATDLVVTDISTHPVSHVVSLNYVDICQDSVPSADTSSVGKSTPNSKATVAVPHMSMEGLAVVPLYQKPRHSEMVQRRIRRPFSLSEVKALVQAVEKLGTGRWRDVKMHAFENANHRTYVDLKDKWKTLVRTATIPPQQRRGEPVPQGLLDRVLSTQAYWSHQQAILHVEQQLPDPCPRLLTPLRTPPSC